MALFYIVINGTVLIPPIKIIVNCFIDNSIIDVGRSDNTGKIGPVFVIRY
jgi:hypothetical protein